MKLIIMFLLLLSCNGKPLKEIDKKRFQKPIKFCVDYCMVATFGNFHNKGSSWGTGSSSMNGLGQQKIFDKVLSYCEKFYEGQDCCSRNHRYGKDNSVETVHGYDYGICAGRYKAIRSTHTERGIQKNK